MTESQLASALTSVAPLHMGALHPVEQLLVLGVAFGPFLVLFVVVYVARRRAIEEERQDQQDQQSDREVGGS
jgi:hypothetical protein